MAQTVAKISNHVEESLCKRVELRKKPQKRSSIHNKFRSSQRGVNASDGSYIQSCRRTSIVQKLNPLRKTSVTGVSTPLADMHHATTHHLKFHARPPMWLTHHQHKLRAPFEYQHVRVGVHLVK